MMEQIGVGPPDLRRDRLQGDRRDALVAQQLPRRRHRRGAAFVGRQAFTDLQLIDIYVSNRQMIVPYGAWSVIMTAASVTPADLTITPRDRRFAREAKPGRWWHGGDPFATAFYNALSATFPKGEAFFVESVRAIIATVLRPSWPRRSRASPPRKRSTAASMPRSTRRAVDAGYDLTPLEDAGADAARLHPLQAADRLARLDHGARAFHRHLRP